MGWESSTDTLGEVILKFSSKEQAIEYAKKNSISYKIIEPKKGNLLSNLMLITFLKINMWRSFFKDKRWFYWSYGGGALFSFY